MVAVDPDVVVLSDIYGISSLVELAKEYSWRPRGVVVLLPTGLRCNDAVDE